MFIRSIRFRIILWYMVVLTLTLSAFSWLLFADYRQGLYRNLDEILRSKADGVVGSIDAFWEAEKLTAMQSDPTLLLSRVFSKINNLNFARVVRHTIEEASGDPAMLDVLVKIFDHQGRLIVATRQAVPLELFSPTALRHVLLGRNFVDTVALPMPDHKRWLWRVFSTPILESGKVAYVVQVATPLNSLNAALNRLAAILFLLLPLTVFLTGVIGAVLARITLRPVDDMIRTIRQIKADNLRMRIRLPDTKDEIQKLAETFNDMLNDLEGAFVSQQRFIQDVSHELRTPLTILKGEIGVALHKVRSAQEYEEVLTSSLQEIDTIGKLVENLLFLARLDNRKTTPDFHDFDAVEHLKTILKEMEIIAEPKQIRLNFEAMAPGLTLRADPQQMRQVMFNLLDNAIKYSPPNGQVTVELLSNEKQAEILVRDNGTGISPQDLPHIFDRFYRVDKSRSSGGFGLGLSIARAIVEAHHGTIRAESGPGAGTTFRISLPLAATA